MLRARSFVRVLSARTGGRPANVGALASPSGLGQGFRILSDLAGLLCGMGVFGRGRILLRLLRTRFRLIDIAQAGLVRGLSRLVRRGGPNALLCLYRGICDGCPMALPGRGLREQGVSKGETRALRSGGCGLRGQRGRG